MQAPVRISSSLARRMAVDLLKAWISGDALTIKTELERSASVPAEAYDTTEEERRCLLKAVAGRMGKCPDLLEARCQNSVLELCLRLLGHLGSAD